jgi:short subunit fatty acids transporter
MSENNEILDRLLVEQTQSPRGETILAQDDQVLITTSRVVNIRYRLYFLILLVIGFLFTYYLTLPAWNEFTSTRADYSALTTKVSSFDAKKKEMDADKALIQKMENQSSLIVSCLNTKQ